MLGFLIGTACLIGFLKLARMGRRGRWGYGGGCRGGHGGFGSGGYGGGFDPRGGDDGWGGHDGPWGARGRGGPFGRWFFLRHLFSRLDTTPGQEKVIKSALDELRAAADKIKGDVKAARPEVANAIRMEQFDETAFGEISHKIDEAAQALRRATVDAVAKIHVALDERQKKLLGDLIESGPRFRDWGGPYRQGVSL